MQSTAVFRQFTGIPINDCRPSQFRLALLLRDLLAIRWYDVSDERLFTGFSTYTAVKGNWFSPSAVAIDGDDVEISEFQFGADRAVPAIAVLLTELGFPSLVAARQSAVRVHLICPRLDDRIAPHVAGANFACELWANYPDASGNQRHQAFSPRLDVLTYLEVVLEVLEAFDGCPKLRGLTVGGEESLYALLVTKPASTPEDRFQLNLKKWLSEEFHQGQLRSKSQPVKSFINALGTQQVLDLCSLRGVYAVIRLLVFAATNWFAFCESVDFREYLSLKVRAGARAVAITIAPDFLQAPLMTMLKRWTDELLAWKDLRAEILRTLGVDPFDPVLECGFLTLAYTHDRIHQTPGGRYAACEKSRPDVFEQRPATPEGAAFENEADFWNRELRLEDNRHFPFEQTLHFWQIHEFYTTYRDQLMLAATTTTPSEDTREESLIRRREEDICLRRWRELASIWVKAPADAQMMAAPFILEVIELSDDLKRRQIYDRVFEVQRLILASASYAPSPRAWRRSVEATG